MLHQAPSACQLLGPWAAFTLRPPLACCNLLPPLQVKSVSGTTTYQTSVTPESRRHMEELRANPGRRLQQSTVTPPAGAPIQNGVPCSGSCAYALTGHKCRTSLHLPEVVRPKP